MEIGVILGYFFALISLSFCKGDPKLFIWVMNKSIVDFVVKIKKGRIEGTITTWRKEWEVRLEVEVTKKTINESLTNIVHFTTGDRVWDLI